MFLLRNHQPLPAAILLQNGLKVPVNVLIDRGDIRFLEQLGIVRHLTSTDPAPLGYTDWALNTDEYGSFYTRVPDGTPEQIEKALKRINARWLSSAEFIRRIPNPIWDAINQARLADMTLQRLKDMLITGDEMNPGNVNLDAEELSDGLNYVVALKLITPEQKAALLE